MKTNLEKGDSKILENMLSAATVIAASIFVIPNKVTGYQTVSQAANNKRGFIFDVLKKEQVVLQADITDHYIEDNSLLHNHISKKPLSFSVSGFKGEVQDVVSSGDDTFTDLAGDIAGAVDLTLQTANLISSSLNKSATTTTNLLDANYKAQQIYRAAAIVGNYKDSVANSSANGMEAFINRKTRQEKAFEMLSIYFQDNMLFTVQTPFGRFTNMLIQELRATQDEDSTSFSDFELTFKQVRKVGTTMKALLDAKGNLAFANGKTTDGTVQSSTPADKGKV